MTDANSESGDLHPLRERAAKAEALGDFDAADETWLALEQAGAPASEVQAARVRLDAKRRIFRKIESVLPGASKHSWIGLDDFITVPHDGIDIRFNLRNKSVDLGLAFGAVRRARSRVEELLGYRTERIGVDLFSSRPQMDEHSRREEGRAAPAWAGASSGKRIRVSLDGKRGSDTPWVVATLTHEYVHLAVRSISGGKCPRWLDEGLAVMFSQNLPRRYHELLTAAVAEGRLWDLTDLRGGFDQIEEPDRRNLAYAQSASIVQYWIEEFGWGFVRELLDEVALSGIDRALAKRSLNDYLIRQNWLRWWAGHAVDSGKP